MLEKISHADEETGAWKSEEAHYFDLEKMELVLVVKDPCQRHYFHEQIRIDKTLYRVCHVISDPKIRLTEYILREVVE